MEGSRSRSLSSEESPEKRVSGTTPQGQNSYHVHDDGKQHGAIKHEIFKNAGKKPGLEIWRIEVSLDYLDSVYSNPGVRPSNFL